MQTKKKIAFVIQNLGMGGAEKFLVKIANLFYENGYQPVIILLGPKQELIPEFNPNIRIVSILKRSRWDIFITNRIRDYIDGQGIEKVFCINTYAFFLTKLAYFRNTKVKFFVSLHSTIPFSVRHYLQNLIYTRFISLSDTVIYLCNNQKTYLQKKYFFRTHDAPVIYNGVDSDYFDPNLFSHPDHHAIRTHLGLSDLDKVIIQVARLQEEKSHTDAIDALKILHAQHHIPAHLLCVGTGESQYRKFLKEYAKDKDLSPYVHFVGNQSDVRKFYRIADIFTLTSKSETFPLSALEAMAFGLPCSLTSVGGAAEMIIEGVTGSISKVGNSESIADSWKNLLGNKTDRRIIRDFVIKNFTCSTMSDQYLKVVGA